jgi:hypothetical protein
MLPLTKYDGILGDQQPPKRSPPHIRPMVKVAHDDRSPLRLKQLICVEFNPREGRTLEEMRGRVVTRGTIRRVPQASCRGQVVTYETQQTRRSEVAAQDL